MNKSNFEIVVCFLIPLLLAAKFIAADVVQVPNRLENGKRANGTVYKMTVTPAKQARPAFKYRLSVEPHKTIPGNAITHYLRSLGENSLNGPWKAVQDQFGMDVFDWISLDTKPEDIPLDKLKTAASFFDSYVDNHLRRATLCRDAEWGLAEERLLGSESIEFLLPSVQQTRSMARALMLRNRLAVIDRRFDDSIEHLRMTYQLAQNVSKMKFLVSNLVGIAEVGLANDGMIDLIAAPDSPNMYWALAELPQPIISIRESIRLESSFGQRYFAELLDVESAGYSNEKWAQSLSDVIAGLKSLTNYGYQLSNKESVTVLPNELLSVAAGLLGYSAAKQRLVDSGMTPSSVEEMAVAQVLLIDASRDYRAIMDDAEKAYYVPFHRSQSLTGSYREELRSQPTRLGAIIVSAFSPAMGQVRQAEVRVQAQINVLMAIESIRNHIATTGKLPASLDDLQLPVRNDPFTGKPLEYQLDGDTAVLEIAHTFGSTYTQKYEISIAK